MDSHAIVVADTEGRIQLWSPGAEKLFGYTAAQAVGSTLDLIVAEKYRERHWDGFRQAMRSGTAKSEGQSTTIPVQRSDGTVIFHPGLFILLRDAHQQVIGAMAIFSAAAAAS